MFDIADVPFAQVSDREKLEYTGNILETGTDQGYKPRKYWVGHDACVALLDLNMAFYMQGYRWWGQGRRRELC
jgi:hypothetical protein